MLKVLITDGLDESGLKILRAAEGVEADMPDGLGAAEIKAILPEYDALIVRSRTKVTADLIENAARLKVVGRAGTGVDNIDVGAASARGILVMNTPGANAMAAAEHTMAMMLALARHIPQATDSMRQGQWEKKKFVGTELYHQTLGIIGLGNIGSIVADRALAMKMDVLAYDPHIVPEMAAVLGAEYVSLDELLARSDFITIHTPLTDLTRRVLNGDTLSKTKPGVRILNCARGGLIDEEALYEFLVKGHVAGAALDVFEKEPPVGSRLLELPNVIFTPHLGASSLQAQENVSRAMASQILDYLQRGLIRNAINFPSISMKDYERLRPYLLLAEKLGNLQGQLCTAMLKLEITYAGSDLQEIPLQPLTQTVIKGPARPDHGRKGEPDKRASSSQTAPDRAYIVHDLSVQGLYRRDHRKGKGGRKRGVFSLGSGLSGSGGPARSAQRLYAGGGTGRNQPDYPEPGQAGNHRSHRDDARNFQCEYSQHAPRPQP